MSGISIVELNKFYKVVVLTKSQRTKDRMEEPIYLNIKEVHAQIIILLKPSLLDVHLKSNTMPLYSYICTHSIGEKWIFNMSNIPSYLILIVCNIILIL